MRHKKKVALNELLSDLEDYAIQIATVKSIEEEFKIWRKMAATRGAIHKLVEEEIAYTAEQVATIDLLEGVL